MNYKADLIVRITINGVIYDSMPMTMDQVWQARSQAMQQFPGINAVIYTQEELAAESPTIHPTLVSPDNDNVDDAVDIGLADNSSNDAPVRIKLHYKNHTLAAIMGALKAAYPAEFHKEVQVIEDTPTDWAIHTNKRHYATIHTLIKDICLNSGAIFKSADTGTAEWDLFCNSYMQP